MDTNSHFATNVYYDRTFDCDAAKILPGEYYYTGKDMLIVTVLGSCVSACIRDSRLGYGGMNHFMLPLDGSQGQSAWAAVASAAPTWSATAAASSASSPPTMKSSIGAFNSRLEYS